MARISKAKKAALAAIAAEAGITTQEAIALANAAKANRVAAKSVPAVEVGTIIHKGETEKTFEEKFEAAKYQAEVSKELAEILTVGGVKPRAKSFRPYYVPQWDGSGSDTKKDATNGKERTAKEDFAGALTEKGIQASFKKGSVQRSQDGDYRGKSAVTMGEMSKPETAADRKARKAAYKDVIVRKEGVNVADENSYKKDIGGVAVRYTKTRRIVKD